MFSIINPLIEDLLRRTCVKPSQLDVLVVLCKTRTGGATRSQSLIGDVAYIIPSPPV